MSDVCLCDIDFTNQGEKYIKQVGKDCEVHNLDEYWQYRDEEDAREIQEELALEEAELAVLWGEYKEKLKALDATDDVAHATLKSEYSFLFIGCSPTCYTGHTYSYLDGCVMHG